MAGQTFSISNRRKREADGDEEEGGSCEAPDTSCETPQDCPSSLCTGPNSVLSCENNQCGCSSSNGPTPHDECESASDCSELKCVEGLEASCWGAECVCLSPDGSGAGDEGGDGHEDGNEGGNNDDDNGHDESEDEDDDEDEDEKEEPDPSEGWMCEYDPPTSAPPSNMLGPAWCDCKHKDGDKIRLQYEGQCDSDCDLCRPWEGYTGWIDWDSCC